VGHAIAADGASADRLYQELAAQPPKQTAMGAPLTFISVDGIKPLWKKLVRLRDSREKQLTAIGDVFGKPDTPETHIDAPASAPYPAVAISRGNCMASPSHTSPDQPQAPLTPPPQPARDRGTERRAHHVR
jgi:hypothetical protein